MRRASIFMGLVLAIALGGCSLPQNTRYGADLSHAKDRPLVKSQTTAKDLIQRFGQPQSSTINADGTETMSWIDNRSTGHVDPADIWFGGRHVTSVTTDTLIATFRDGKLVLCQRKMLGYGSSPHGSG